MSTSTSNTFTDSHTITLLTSGLAEQVSTEPLVALIQERRGHHHHDPDREHNSYRLLVHMYIPDGVEPRLNHDLDHVELQSTEAGELELRQIYIDYDTPMRGTSTYSLWELRATYIVEGKVAQAIRVRYVVGDPETSRGTVTSVATT